MVLHPYTAQTLPNRPAADGPAFASAAPLQNPVMKMWPHGTGAVDKANNDGAPPGVPMH